jgi:hypothetical protein
MAKSISSDWTVAGNAAVYTLKDEATGEAKQFTVDLAALMGNAAEAMKALANGVRVRMREATGGKAFDDACALLADFAASVNGGMYPVRAREAGETRSSPFILALARVFYSGDTEKAQAEYDTLVADKAAALKVDLEAEDDASVKAAQKLKRDLRAEMAKNPHVAAALESLKLEAAEAALDRQRARAAAAAKAAAADDAAA